MSTFTSVDLARSIAVPTALLLSGFSAAHSITAIPGLLHQPTKMAASAFTYVFYAGGNIVVPGSALSTVACSYLAYRATSRQERRLQVLAAVLAIASLPYTRFVMMPTITRLISIGKLPEVEATAVAGEAVVLLKNWAAHNWLRAAFQLGCGLVGLYAWVN